MYLTRAAVVEAIDTGARRSWVRWEGFYGALGGAVIGRIKPPHKVLGLIAVVVSAALTSLNPAWSLDLHLDRRDQPVSVQIRDAGRIHFIPINLTGRKLRLGSPGFGEGDIEPFSLGGRKAGEHWLAALSEAAAAVLVPVEMENRGRGRGYV